MKATVAVMDYNSGVVTYEQVPAASEIHIVSKGQLVETFKRNQGDSAVVINMDQVLWTKVDLND